MIPPARRAAVEIDCRLNGEILISYDDHRLDEAQWVRFDRSRRLLSAVVKDGLISLSEISLGSVSSDTAEHLCKAADILLVREGEGRVVIGGAFRLELV